MAIQTFPLQLDLKSPPATAGEAQALCARIETILMEHFGDALACHEGGAICLQPIAGVHQKTTTLPE